MDSIGAEVEAGTVDGVGGGGVVLVHGGQSSA